MKNSTQLSPEESTKDTQEKFCKFIFKMDWTKNDSKEFQKLFKDIIELGNYWHVPYQLITKNIYNMDISNRNRIKNSIIERFNDIDEEHEKILEDTLRHVELAIIQKEYIDKNMLSANSELKEINNELEEIQDTKSKIYTDFITILGIFTAITFAIFGGLQLIGNALGNLTGDITLSKVGSILIIASVILLSTYLILMALIVGLSKLLSGDKNNRYKFTGKITAWIVVAIIVLFMIGCSFVVLKKVLILIDKSLL